MSYSIVRAGLTWETNIIAGKGGEGEEERTDIVGGEADKESREGGGIRTRRLNMRRRR